MWGLCTNRPKKGRMGARKYANKCTVTSEFQGRLKCNLLILLGLLDFRQMVHGLTIAPLEGASPNGKAPMTFRINSKSFWFAALVLAVSCTVCPSLYGQTLYAKGPVVELPDAPMAIEPAPVIVSRPAVTNFGERGQHKFFDRANCALFVTTAAFSTADFVVTRANLQSGGQELNPMVRVFGRSSAGLAVNFAGQTLGVIGMSYFFHKTGHHKMERLLSVVNIGGSAGAVGYGLAHR